MILELSSWKGHNSHKFVRSLSLVLSHSSISMKLWEEVFWPKWVAPPLHPTECLDWNQIAEYLQHFWTKLHDPFGIPCLYSQGLNCWESALLKLSGQGWSLISRNCSPEVKKRQEVYLPTLTLPKAKALSQKLLFWLFV